MGEGNKPPERQIYMCTEVSRCESIGELVVS